jgi:hypothetical protein
MLAALRAYFKREEKKEKKKRESFLKGVCVGF